MRYLLFAFLILGVSKPILFQNDQGNIQEADTGDLLFTDSLSVSTTALMQSFKATDTSYVMGNFGVGTRSPGVKLTVDDGGIFVNGENDTAGTIIIRGRRDSTPITLFETRSYKAGFTTVGADTLIYRHNADAFDGTNLLHVAQQDVYIDGSVAASVTPGMFVWSTNSGSISTTSQRMWLNKDGNLGIGAYPTSKLYLAGSGFVTGTFTVSSGISTSSLLSTSLVTGTKLYGSEYVSSPLLYASNISGTGNLSAKNIDATSGEFTRLTASNYVSAIFAYIGGAVAINTQNEDADFHLVADGVNNGLLIENNTEDSVSNFIRFRKSRGAYTAETIVASGDDIGYITFNPYNGTNYNFSAANFGARMDGTPGTTDVPGAIFFSTTPDGTATPLERMVIKNNGNVGIGYGLTSPTQTFAVSGTSNFDGILYSETIFNSGALSSNSYCDAFGGNCFDYNTFLMVTGDEAVGLMTFSAGISSTTVVATGLISTSTGVSLASSASISLGTYVQILNPTGTARVTINGKGSQVYAIDANEDTTNSTSYIWYSDGYDNNGTQLMRLWEGGQLMVGTATGIPSGSFNVSGTSFIKSANKGIHVSATGNVGINYDNATDDMYLKDNFTVINDDNTNSPQVTLESYRSSSPRGQLRFKSSGGVSGTPTVLSANAPNGRIRQETYTGAGFEPIGFIDFSNITSPITGNAPSKMEFSVNVTGTASPAVVLTINQSNVGIGDTTPTATLDVSGNVSVTGTSGNLSVSNNISSAKITSSVAVTFTSSFSVSPTTSIPASPTINLKITRQIMRSPDGNCWACGPQTGGVWKCDSQACPAN